MTRWIAFIFSFCVFCGIIELIRREKLRFHYALGWLLAAALAMIGALFPFIPFFMADLLGFELPSNFIFFAILSVLILMTLLMTIFLCRQDRRNDAMAQKIGLLEAEVNALKKQKAGM